MQGIKGCYELYIMVARQLVSPCHFTPAKSVQMAQEDTVQVLTALHAHDTSVPYKDLSRVCLVFGKHLDLTLLGPSTNCVPFLSQLVRTWNHVVALTPDDLRKHRCDVGYKLMTTPSHRQSGPYQMIKHGNYNVVKTIINHHPNHHFHRWYG